MIGFRVAVAVSFLVLESSVSNPKFHVFRQVSGGNEFPRN